MFLTIFDLILILVLFLFIAIGFVSGLIQGIGAIVGVFLGAWAAVWFYEPLGVWLTPILLGHGTIAKIVAFLLIFGVVNRLVGLLFYIVDKFFGLISIIPFLKTINRILGAILGFIEGILAISFVLFFITKLGISVWLNGIIAASKVASWLIGLAAILTPLLPKILK
ncbi:MAG: hypothetical protein A2663_00005 [Candidatus Buchananbacteria bacterium RIFCSPHIGHO2_01_FULL_46_12]|uniref:Colicin V production protein n=1 Tax=Candidatus Buchananbacteria bacterium RIFCSPHIGHO2_01_FULL_46_12 TaxID=1797536 RepID=A0A1G1Y9E1_9BACT|nr:MAG: hypothetical protein A2663_00005 [Candidatus Buchananbacteria bacterium RIFCSPHIGHO2_01_FULL_46_12]